MTSNEEVARRFAEKEFPEYPKELHGSNFFIRNAILYSYGEHFPLAMWLSSTEVLYNISKYSRTTAKHQYVLRSALRMVPCKYVKVSTQEFKDIIRRKDTNDYDEEDFTKGMKVVKTIFVTRPLEYDKVTFSEMERLLPVFFKEQCAFTTRRAKKLAKETCEAWRKDAEKNKLIEGCRPIHQ